MADELFEDVGGADDLFADVDKKPLTTGETVVGVARAAGQGLTIGLGDEIEAGVRTGFGMAGDYDETLKGVRSDIKEFREKAPVISTASEVAGAVPTLFAPLGWAGRAGQLLTGSRLSNAANMTGRQLAAEGMKVGATQGGLHGFGRGEGGVTNRATGAVVDGAIGAGVGRVAAPVLDAAVNAVGRVSRAASQARRELGSTPAESARREAARAFEIDGTNLTQRLDELTPDIGRRQVGLTTREGVRDALIRYGDELAANGGDTNAARRAVVDSMIDADPSLNPSTLRAQVNAAVNAYDDANRIPLMLSEVGGVGDDVNHSVGLTARAAHNRMNEGAAEFRRAVIQRQQDINQSIDDAIATVAGGRDAEALLDRLIDENKLANSILYENARLLGNELDGRPIQRILDRYRAEFDDTSGVSKAVRKVLDAYEQPPGSGRTVNNLTWFQRLKSDLDDAIDGSYVAREGNQFRPRGTERTAALTRLKNELLEEVDGQLPAYADARAQAASGFRNENAIAISKDLALRNSRRQRRALREFRARDPRRLEQRRGETDAEFAARRNQAEVQRALIRVHFAQNISEMLRNRNVMHDVAKLFSSRSARDTMEEVLGPRASASIAEQLERAGVASRTYNSLSGSQTTPLREAMDESSLSSRLSTAVDTMTNPSRAIGAIGDYVESMHRRRKDTELLRILGINSENPADFYRVIRDLAQMQRDIAGRDARAAQQIDDVIGRLRGIVARVGTGAATRSATGGQQNVQSGP